MTHLIDKGHFDKHTIGRVNSAIMFGLIGGGLAACALAALIYDAERLLATW